MKKLKLILSLFVTISLVSCGDSETKTIALDFSIANVTGSYELKSFSADIINTAITQNVPATISTATQVGDTFNADLTLNSNGTFTLVGNYRVVTTVTPIGGSATTNPEIIILDTSGTYTINTQSRTISFTTSNPQLLDGVYDVAVFNETTLSFTQEASKQDGGITTTTDASIVFNKE